MLIYNVLTILCLIIIAFITILFLCNLLIIKDKNKEYKRQYRIEYLKSFKKGRGGVIYFIIIPLYWMGAVYGGEDVLEAFFFSIKRSLEMVVLKFDTGSIIELCNASRLYYITVYITYFIIVLNSILFIYSFVLQNVWGLKNEILFGLSRKERIYLIGNNDENIKIYHSDKKSLKCIVDSVGKADREKLYYKDVCFRNTENVEKVADNIINSALVKNRKIKVIINTGNENKNLNVAKIFCEKIGNAVESGCDKKAENTSAQTDNNALFTNLKVYVFCDEKYNSIYEQYIKNGRGILIYVNKYQKIAVDFVDKYPLTKFMTEEQIDYDNACIKPDVDINTFLIGFGKTNRQVYLTSVANNQFVQQKGEDVVLKKVNYYIIDKIDAQNNKNLNHNIYRFKQEVSSANRDEYLPLPEYPSNEIFCENEKVFIDVNDDAFYKKIREVSEKNKKSFNYFIIAFGDDLENLDLAKKMIEKRREWGINNFYIFVREREKHDLVFSEEDKCFSFANESEVVYNADKIFNDSLYTMALNRHVSYAVESAIKNNKNLCVEQVGKEAKIKWYKDLEQYKRESNLYCCLSLRSRLNLIGLDYAAAAAGQESVTEEEFREIYEKDNPVKNSTFSEILKKSIIDYDLSEVKNTKRYNLAELEHLRWNSFMITKGFVPATINEILSDKNQKGKFTNGRSEETRKHGNLTNFEGLKKFRKLIADRDNKNEADTDVIQYDYQIMDDAYWLLKENGYIMCKKK